MLFAHPCLNSFKNFTTFTEIRFHETLRFSTGEIGYSDSVSMIEKVIAKDKVIPSFNKMELYHIMQDKFDNI